jgi:hypothetical protein
MAGLAVLSKMPKIMVPRGVIRGIQAMFSIVVLVLSAYGTISVSANVKALCCEDGEYST